MTTLTFRSNANLRKLARDTLRASEFDAGWDPTTDAQKTTTDPGFCLVHDDGVYLMSAFKATNEKTPHANGYVIHAHGLNPNTNEHCWEDARQAVGGDDFSEFVPLDRDMLSRIFKGGAVKIKLSVTQIVVMA
jgi:hypothetical protein